MADGYALIEFNTNGESRVKEVSYFDFRLGDTDIEYEDVNEQIRNQISEKLNDVLVMVIFSIHFEMSHHYEYGYECDGITINLENYNIVKMNYKEFYRLIVTEETKGYTSYILTKERENDRYFRELIGDWEEFYDEDFKPKLEPKLTKKDFL